MPNHDIVSARVSVSYEWSVEITNTESFPTFVRVKIFHGMTCVQTVDMQPSEAYVLARTMQTVADHVIRERDKGRI